MLSSKKTFISGFQKLTVSFIVLCSISLLASMVNASVVVLTDTSPNFTIAAGNSDQVYGTAGANQITLQSGADAELINFPGSNTITIQSDSSLFTVSRSGASVIFEGSDGTELKMPATTTSQSIIFNDGPGY